MSRPPAADLWLVLVAGAAAPGVLGFGVAGASPARPRGDDPAPVAPVPAPAPAPAPVPGLAPAPARATDSSEVDWSVLTQYEYQQGLVQLPDAIKALDGKRVTMGGFLMPIYEFDDIHEFSLVPTHMSCCFGVPAGLNGQVYVKVSGKRGLPNTNEPLRVTGVFRAKEVKEAGYVLAIWAIEDADVKIVGY